MKIRNILITLAVVALVVYVATFFVPVFGTVSYNGPKTSVAATSTTAAPAASLSSAEEVGPSLASTTTATHLKTPSVVKAIYMTSWVASDPSLRANVINIIDTTEVNAVVIDIKDYSGNVSFLPHDPALIAVGSGVNRISDIDSFIAQLHQKGIYVIGRMEVFQDPYYAKKYPDQSIRKKTDGTVWTDSDGLSYIYPGSKQDWDYIVALSKESYSRGFDEINYDYIRFPSDGDLANMDISTDGETKAEVVTSFFQYLHQALAGSGIVTSADLFGLTTNADDDLGIGQVLTNALPNFDYVDPMVYPSHYSDGFIGYKNPAEYPYQVVKYALDGAAQKISAFLAATSTPADVKARVSDNQIRPWLQDFNLGAVYTAAMVRDQIQATNDAGFSSWLVWDPTNKYTPGAFLSQ